MSMMTALYPRVNVPWFPTKLTKNTILFRSCEETMQYHPYDHIKKTAFTLYCILLGPRPFMSILCQYFYFLYFWYYGSPLDAQREIWFLKWCQLQNKSQTLRICFSTCLCWFLMWCHNGCGDASRNRRTD